MRKKAAIATGVVVRAIVTIVLILVMIYVMPAQIKDPIKRLLGIGGNFTELEGGLAVTEAEFQTTELKTVSNSVNALACSINSMATGTFPHGSCAEAYDLSTRDMPSRTINKDNYAKVIGDALLSCFKNFKPLKGTETKKLPCYTLNQEGEQFEIKEEEIQKYLEDLFKKGGIDQAIVNELSAAGVWEFGKQYSLELSADKTLKKDSMICGHDKDEIILTDDKMKCGIQEPIKCEGEGARPYGASCLKCEKRALACCEYFITSTEKAESWMNPITCLKHHGAMVTPENGLCGGLEKPFAIDSCTITNFYLPQELEDYETWIKGLGDPQYLIYYERFPDGEEKAWQVETSTFVMIGLGVSAALTLIPMGKQSFKAIGGARRFSKLGKLAKNLNKLDNAEDIAKQNKKITKLLQKMSNKGDDVAKAIKMVHETTSHGAASLAIKELGDDALKAMRTEVDRVIRNVGDVDLMSGKMTTANYINEYSKIVDPSGFPKTAKLSSEGKSVLKTRIKKVVTGDRIDPKAKALNNKIDEIIDASGDTNADDLIERITKDDDVLDAVSEKAIRGASEITDLSRLGRTMKKAGFAKMIKAYSKKGSFREPMKKSISKLKFLKSTNREAFERAVQEADDLAASMIDDAGNINWGRLIDKTDDASLEGFFRLVDDPVAKGLGTGEINELVDVMDGRTFGKAFYRGALNKVGAQGTGAWQRGRNFVKAQLKGVGCAAIAPAGAATVATVTAVPLLFTSLKACGSWIKTNQLPLLLALGYLYNEEDSKNEKYMPIGNNLAVTTPKILKKEREPAKFSLEGAENYYISMYRDEKQKPQKLYFASPCKADLEVKKEYCSGKLNKGDYVYNYTLKGERFLVPTKPLNLKEKTYYYAWDSYTDKQKKSFMKGKDINDAWYSGIFSDGADIVRELAVTDPSYHKITYRFVYNAYPDSDISYFFKTLKRFNLADVGDEFMTDRICYGDLLLRGLYWAEKKDRFIEKAKDTLGVVEQGGKYINKNNDCFKKFLDSIIDFELETTDGDITNYSFTCNGKSFEEYGWLVRHAAHELDGFYTAACEGNVLAQATGQIGFDDDDGVSEALSKGSFNDWLKGPKVRFTNYDWTKKDTWKEWESFVVEQNVNTGVANGLYLSSMFDELAKNSAYHLILYDENDVIDKKEIVRHIDPETQKMTTSPTLQNYNNIFIIETKIPCLTVKTTPPNNAWGGKEGKNFCYSGYSWKLKTAEVTLNAIGLIGGIAVSALSIGGAVPVFIAAADIGSIGAAFIIEKCGGWPNHSAGNIIACFS